MKQSGYVLLAVLIFLQLFTLLGFSILEAGAMVMQMDERDFQQQQLFANADQILSELEHQPINKLCISSLMSHIDYEPLTWWQSHTCSANFAGFRYYYTIEALGGDACGLIRNFNNHIVTADYYRITLLIPAKKPGATGLLLQSIIVKPSFNQQICVDNIHYVTVGRQSWRELCIRKLA